MLPDNPNQRRQYRRIGTGVQVLYQGLPSTRIERDYLSGIAENLSLGGMYIATDDPFAPGTMVILEFRTPDMGPEEEPVCAHACVRWRRRWGASKGMGISFLELEGIERRRLEEWLDSVLDDDAVSQPGSPFPLASTFLFAAGRSSDPQPGMSSRS